MKKVLRKNARTVSVIEYRTQSSENDENYYYVGYTSAWDKDKMFHVYTNSHHYGEKRKLFTSTDKEECVRTAYAINNALRLLAGYYDNSPTQYVKFPLIN